MLTLQVSCVIQLALVLLVIRIALVDGCVWQDLQSQEDLKYLVVLDTIALLALLVALLILVLLVLTIISIF
jgi:hypothetical protein